jgi:actin-related protein
MSSSSDDDINSVVFDIGSYSAKAGFAGDDAPLVEIKYVDTSEFRESFCNNGFKLFHPDEFDAAVYEKIISKCYDSLNADSVKVMRDSPALFSEHFHACPNQREKLSELMFEKFGVPGMYIAPSPILSLYSSGRGSGIVIESGNSMTQTAVIYEGFMFANSVLCNNKAGADVTDSLRKYWAKDHVFKDADYIYLKEKYSSCLKSQTTEVQLPDGTMHSIYAAPLNRCTELLFDDSDLKYSLPKMVYEGIMAANIHCRKHLFFNVILSGGNTKISGLPDLLKEHLDKIVNEHHKGSKVKVVAPPDRSYSPWIGGSIVGSLSCYMNTLLISKEEYQDHGSKIIHSRCINPKDSIQG